MMRKAMVLTLLMFFCAFSTSARGAMFSELYEKKCLQNGWNREELGLPQVKRQFFWKAPEGPWKYGAIIVLHGGGADYSSWCGGPKLAMPMIEFAAQAIDEGFAVFAPDSTRDVFSDRLGKPCGKRFNCLNPSSENNPDLLFIKELLDKVIPAKRPQGSAVNIFITGVSNGGFTAILAATVFDSRISAFAPVSAGDPYGTYIDCNPALTPRDTPGLFFDRETKKTISEESACECDGYANETPLTSSFVRKPPFKLFHHQGDALVDISCMKKAKKVLIHHAYPDMGEFVIKDREDKALWKHLWQREYNRPMLDFFKDRVKSAKRGKEGG